ncbi:PPE domain-containing protein [Lentzea flaviverrucosa]|uniref:PPE family protein n=1 Tax=Lentzea flaviverrucosa TaxID=200379 RepID=A0A1H9BIM0_9PSEU|nr:PPE domain-containing protein [Lentzea flaviverrucosa]RDI31759.1 PPE family protein [Lentzea flaviverrucosa]SEP88850.1 PPE family protein [Lentzea flaviverrucosa]
MLPENVPIEPDRVLTDPQNWAAQSHQQLYDSVHHNNDPGQSGEIGAQWAKYASELVECARQITVHVTASESQWTGDAADGARTAMRKLADWVDETARTAVEVGDKVTEQGRVMATARAQMPEPFEFDWAGTAAFLSQPGIPSFVRAAADVSIANSIARAVHDQAVTVMTDMENDSRRIDSSTPAFRAPFNPVTGQVEDPAIALRAFSGAPAPYTAEVPVAEHPQGGNSHVISPLSPSGGERSELPPSSPAGRGPGGYSPSSAAPAGGHTYLTPPVPGQDVTAAASYAPSQQNQQSYSPQAPASGVTHTGGADHKPHLPANAGPAGFTPQTPKAGVRTPPPHVPQNGVLPSRQNPDVVPKPNPAASREAPLPASTPPAPRGSGGGSANGAGSGSGLGNPNGAGGMSGAGGPGGGGSAGPLSAAKGFGGGGPGGAASSAATGAGTQPGTSAGVNPVQGRSGSPSGMTPPGGSSAAVPGTGGTGGAPPGGPATGRGEEDKEHRSAGYIIGGDLFEVPGSDLPPAVIGDTRTKKQWKADGRDHS